MAGRIRSIKPEILEDEKTAALPHLEWRLFVSLWLIADDYGNFRGDPVYVLGQTLWASGETRETIAGALDELVAVSLLARYMVRGQAYYHITGWAKHQKVDKPGKPRMPGPDEADIQPSQHVAPNRETFEESSRDIRESLAPDLRPGPPTGTKTENSPSACAIPPAVPQPAPASVPAVSPPAPARKDIAIPRPAAPQLSERERIELAGIANRLALPPAEATLRASPPPAPIAHNPDDPRAIGRLAEAFYRRISDARIQIAAELKLPAPLPFPAITPGTNRRGFADLRDRIREEGALAPAACERVIANLIAQARAKKTIDWLGERAFGDKAWPNARDGIDPSARPPVPRRGDPLPPAPPPKRPDPPPPDPVLSPEDRAAIAELAARVGANPEAAAAGLAKRFGDARAGPERAAPTDPDPSNRRRKAAT